MAKKTSTPEKTPIIVENPEIISQDFTSDNKQPTKDQQTNPEYELLSQIAYYANELVVELNNVYIGGIAAQKRDQLFEVLSKFKNLN